ncbi:hypothetical protein DM02DRAFT_59718 [Periconia macrospinosa]|uniref:Uncharacterized protein n=1 Tax=Periconia macrospinosa TaxID=97972 RepID=A0A2V1DJR7_9PLEO|nr:hypothetical protein DM02DRAFT_59718 [Periconia macrospinosa]
MASPLKKGSIKVMANSCRKFPSHSTHIPKNVPHHSNYHPHAYDFTTTRIHFHTLQSKKKPPRRSSLQKPEKLLPLHHTTLIGLARPTPTQLRTKNIHPSHRQTNPSFHTHTHTKPRAAYLFTNAATNPSPAPKPNLTQPNQEHKKISTEKNGLQTKQTEQRYLWKNRKAPSPASPASPSSSFTVLLHSTRLEWRRPWRWRRRALWW